MLNESPVASRSLHCMELFHTLNNRLIVSAFMLGNQITVLALVGVSVLISTLTPTEASTLQPSQFPSDNYSRPSYATSLREDKDEGQLCLPKLEDVTNSFPFECPYYRSLLAILTVRDWK